MRIFPKEKRGTTRFFKPTGLPGIWNHHDRNFEIVHKGCTQGSWPADLFSIEKQSGMHGKGKNKLAAFLSSYQMVRAESSRVIFVSGYLCFLTGQGVSSS
jgi:hypothetical protein